MTQITRPRVTTPSPRIPDARIPDDGGRRLGLLGQNAPEQVAATDPAVQVPTLEELARLSAAEVRTRLQEDRRFSVEEIRAYRLRIGALGDPEQRAELYALLQQRVPFHNQRDNESLGADVPARKGERIATAATANNMCNLTALAGNLDYLGVSVPEVEGHADLDQPEDRLEMMGRNRQYGDGKKPKAYDRRAADSTGWKGTARQLGVDVDYIAGSKLAQAVPEDQWRNWDYWQGTLREHLRQGRAIMVNLGPLGRGHYVRIVSITDTGVVADDPYGASTLLGNNRGYQTTTDPKTKKARKLINRTSSDSEDQAENPGSRLEWTSEEVGNQNFSEIHVLHAPESETQDIQKLQALIEQQRTEDEQGPPAPGDQTRGSPNPLTTIPLRRRNE